MTTRQLLLAGCLLPLTQVVSAQWVTELSDRIPQQLSSIVADQTPVQHTSLRGSENVVWSEDFANGIAGNNGIGAWTLEGPNGNLWKRTTNGPNGAYTRADQRISSTTVENGYMLFASDSANTNWATTPPRIVANPIDWEGSLVSPLLDFSTTPFLELEFQQRARYCCNSAPHLLEISTDGGATWSSSTPTTSSITVNTDPGTHIRKYNITNAISADPSNVKIRFRHSSDAGTSHYHWQIDDIRIATLPEYERRMNLAYTVFTDGGEEYGRIPRSQIPGALNIGAEVYNHGLGDQTNVEVTCVLRNSAGEEVMRQTTNLGRMASGDTLISDDFMNLPTLELDRYSATFTVSSEEDGFESNPDDDSLVRYFEVTENVYSLDGFGNYPDGEAVGTQQGTSSFDNNISVHVMTLYPLTTEATAVSATVILGSNSVAGADAKIEMSIHPAENILSTEPTISLPVNGMTSEQVELTEEHISAGQLTIPFIAPIVLSPGYYYVSAFIQGNGTRDVTTDAEVFIADDRTVDQPGRASMIYTPSPVVPPTDGTEGRKVWSNGNASAIRLNLTAPVGISERTNTSRVAMYPNPTNGILNIVNDDAGLMNIEVIDLLGATVRTATFTGRTTLDLSGLSHGLYSVRVGNGKHTSVERITLH